MVPLRSGGRPAIHPRRRIVEAILYVNRTGCSWRQLPHDFPPWDTVYWYFKRWNAEGTTDRIHNALRDAVRDAVGRDPIGLLVVVLVTAASVQDRDGGRLVLDKARMAMPSIVLVGRRRLRRAVCG